MNFNATLGSQTISDSYKRRLSNRFAEQVDYQGSRGDFIGLLSRGPDDSFLSELFNQQWGLHGTESPANLRLMALKDGHAGGEFHQGQFPSLETLIANGDLLRSDHANFWIVNNKNFYASLPAILLTDTGKSLLQSVLQWETCRMLFIDAPCWCKSNCPFCQEEKADNRFGRATAVATTGRSHP